MTKYVIRPLKRILKTFFDSTAKNHTIFHPIKERDFLLSPELVEGQSNLPIHVPKEHIEQWIDHEALNVPYSCGQKKISLGG